MKEKVGIFYLVDKKIMFDTCELDSAETLKGISMHSDYFNYFYNTLVKQKPEHSEEDYDVFPRGRIVYNSKKKSFGFIVLPGLAVQS